MTALRRLTDPGAWPALAETLRQWLPVRRWFAAKDRTIATAEITDAVLVTSPDTGRDAPTANGADPVPADALQPVVDVFVEVTYAEGGSDRYQVPLATGSSTTPAETVTTLHGQPVVDAMAVPAAARTLARRALATTPQHSVAGSTVTGRLPHPGPADSRRDEPPRGSRAEVSLHELAEPRPLEAEQSNTSVVFGDALILKVFRRLEEGTNPDVEVTRALTEHGFAHVPSQRAALELQTADDADEGTALAVLSEFVPRAAQGWTLAVDEVGALTRGGTADDEACLRATLEDLGAVIGRLHAALATAFGSRATAPADADSWAREMTGQAERVLDAAARHAPDTAAPVLARRAELLSRLARLASHASGGRLLRIHGDLHLGQVLRDQRGVWQILDFEGEPARTLAQRRAFNSPLRDVAGMLRSFDYAAATASLADGHLPPAVSEWRADARATFLRGYLSVAAGEGLVASEVAVRDSQLAAFELDKAVYELGYELANRPSWVSIPAAGILRVLDATEPGRDAGE